MRTETSKTNRRDAVGLEHVTRTHLQESFEVRALDDVTLRIPEHSFVGIMGPSGSGKTTLLNLITGIDHPNAGHVSVGGEEIAGMNENDLADWRARHIGLIFKFYNLIPVLTAYENVELPLLLTDLPR
jgi:putative ABC transport system ATP-binding protein